MCIGRGGQGTEVYLLSSDEKADNSDRALRFEIGFRFSTR
jgi:hypothetical protein